MNHAHEGRLKANAAALLLGLECVFFGDAVVVVFATAAAAAAYPTSKRRWQFGNRRSTVP
jgi:hypothetical protein